MSERNAGRSRLRTLLLTLVFAPDTVSTANLLTELVDHLANLGHEFIVVTTTPHYTEETDAIAQQPLRPRWDHVLYESQRNGTVVYHGRIPKKRRRILSRLIDYGVFHLITTAAALRLARNYNIVLAPSPPLSIGLEALLVAGVARVPFVYNVQEIYPDIAVALGILKNRLAIRIAEILERFVYDRARCITVISERFRDRLMEKGVPREKIIVIPNFVDTNAVYPSKPVNEFSSAHGLRGRFVILYAGNIGLTQDFESLLDSARLVEDLTNAMFLVVGNGARAQWLEREIKQRVLSNVRLLPYQPKRSVIDVYATSSLCIVPLKEGTAYGTFPSKIYTIMAAGRPAIVMADRDSELSDVVLRAGCGLVIRPGGSGDLATSIRRVYEDQEQLTAWGEAGRRYVVQHHSATAAAVAYDKLLREIARPDDRA